jgi:hypothetical protein
MRRALAAAALVVALGAALVPQATRTPSPAPVHARHADRAPALMADAVAIGSLRGVAAIGAGQARELRAAVHRCGTQAARGRCALMPLAHAASGARLSEVVLRAVSARVVAGPCMAMASRLAGLVSTIAWLGVDGVRSRTWPGYTWRAARAAARTGARVIALNEGRWPRHCLRIREGPRA